MSSNKNKNTLNKHFEESSREPTSRGTKTVKRDKFDKKVQTRKSNRLANRKRKK